MVRRDDLHQKEPERMNTIAVTGAWSYSGRAVAAALVRDGHRVVSLTNRLPPDPDPHRGRVRRIPYGQFSVPALAPSLDDAEAMYSGYWVRHDRPPVGHRGPWTSHAQAVEQSAALIEAARQAGVRRLVWTSIANPGLDPDLSYYRGKAEVERLVRESGVSYAILRPACFFGRGEEDILIQNVAWAARHLPWIPIPSAPPTSSGRSTWTTTQGSSSRPSSPATAGRATPPGRTGSSSAPWSA